MVSHRTDRFDAVVDEERLPASLFLTENGIFDDMVIVLRHIRLDRMAIRWRRRDRHHIADAGETHVKGTRDRCRRQCQHIDAGCQRFPLLLLHDTEALLFIDDEKP